MACRDMCDRLSQQRQGDMATTTLATTSQLLQVEVGVGFAVSVQPSMADASSAPLLAYAK